MEPNRKKPKKRAKKAVAEDQPAAAPATQIIQTTDIYGPGTKKNW
jgi:hypothetical protein